MLLAETAGYAPYLIVLLGSGGILGAILALLKLSGDKNYQAVETAHGAMEMMQSLLESLEEELNRAKERHESCRKECLRLQEEMVQARAMIRQLSS